MNLNQTIRLRTLPDQILKSSTSPDGTDTWALFEQNDGSWIVRSQYLTIRPTNSDHMWNILGGVVGWTRWTPESQEMIEHCGGKSWFNS